MSKCNQCGIEIADATESCPLCHSVLESCIGFPASEEGSGGSGSGGRQKNKGKRGGSVNLTGKKKEAPRETENLHNPYPDVKTKRKKIHFVLRLLIFLWLAISGILLFVNGKTEAHWWTLLVSAVLLYPIFLLYIIEKDKGYLHRIFYLVIGAELLIVLIDVATGFHRWSVNYVLPGGMILVDVVLIVLMIVNRRNWQSYMIFQLLTIVIGAVPLLLIRLGIVTVPLFSEIAFYSAVLVFLGTLIMGGSEAHQELRRRFHV